MTREEIIEQLNLTIGLIKQDGKDWLDDRDIPMLEECVKALSKESCRGKTITREEALDYAKSELDAAYKRAEKIGHKGKTKYIEVLEMAILALSQEPSRNMEEIAEVIKSDVDAETKCKMISNILTAKPHYFELLQEPCDDAISREDALKLIYDFKENHTKDREKHPINYGTLLDLIRLIRELPPVTQKSTECDDAVGRQAVLDLLEDTNNGWIINEVSQLPPVTQKSGKWNEYYTSQKGNDVFNCKECGHTFVVTQGKDNMNYCPNCGCRMVEPQGRSEKE